MWCPAGCFLFLQKHLYVSVESHTGCCTFQASCMPLCSLQASQRTDSGWRGKDSAQDCRPMWQPAHSWAEQVPPFEKGARERNQKLLSPSCPLGNTVSLKSFSKSVQQAWPPAFAVARYLQARQPEQDSRHNGQVYMLGINMQQCQIWSSGSSKGWFQDMSDKTSNEPLGWLPSSAFFQPNIIIQPPEKQTRSSYLETFLNNRRIFPLTQTCGNSEFADWLQR